MSSNKRIKVKPLPGLAPWFGGKRNLAARLIARIDAIPHETYAEPFLGMGGVFLRRHSRPSCEVVNDRSKEVVNLFRVVKHHASALLGEIQSLLHSRTEFERQLRVDPETLTDIQRAARFYFIMRHNFGGLPGSKSYPARPKRAAGLPRRKVRLQIEATAKRLAMVGIECLPYETFISRFDHKSTLFYLDPPYWGREDKYGKGLFERADFEQLSQQLKTIKGHFILSINDVPEIREMFRWANIEEEVTTYRTGGVQRTTELVITGGSAA